MRKILFLLPLLASCLPEFMNAQNNEVENNHHFHLETNMVLGTRNNQLLPFSCAISPVYQINQIVSVSLTAQGQYFLPKEGLTKDYNYNFGLGGGIGVKLFTLNYKEPSLIEARVSYLSSVSNKDFKNNKYDVGLYWRPQCQGHSLVPVVGVGYTITDFSSFDTTKGLYCSFGLRF